MDRDENEVARAYTAHTQFVCITVKLFLRMNMVCGALVLCLFWPSDGPVMVFDSSIGLAYIILQHAAYLQFLFFSFFFSFFSKLWSVYLAEKSSVRVKSKQLL